MWQSAAELARRHGIYVVARSLRLGYSTLKKQVNGERVNGSGAVPTRGRKKPQASFLELIGAARESTDEYVMEFESVRGPKLRIQCKTTSRRIGGCCCVPGEEWNDDPDHAADAGAGRDRAGGWPEGHRFLGSALPGKTRGRSFFGIRVRLSRRSGTAIRLLTYDGQGYWLLQKRLSKGRFRWWPEADQPAKRLDVPSL